MLRYILRRILLFFPTLVVITLLGFAISVNAPGDPVERMVVAAQSAGEVGSQSISQIEQKLFWRKKLGLDLPLFYVSLHSLSRPDTMYRISDKSEREAMDRLIDQYGNWKEIQEYYSQLNLFHSIQLGFHPDTTKILAVDRNNLQDAVNQLNFESSSLKACYDEKLIALKMAKIQQLLQQPVFPHSFLESFKSVCSRYSSIQQHPTIWKNFIPTLSWYSKNQYDRWLFGDGDRLTGNGAEFSRGLIRGDFGTSYVTKQPISDVIFSKIGWSMFFALLSVLLAYLVSIPVGVKAAAKRGGKFDRGSSLVLFLLYSMPSFWLATLLLMTFANPDVLHWFPASGVKPAIGYPEGAGMLTKIKLTLPYLILPAICYTYSSFAFLSRTMRVSMIEVIGQDYIRTARAKGLSENTVVWKHAFRNSLFPIITVFANIFPAAIGGSVILETIFTIPGMGSEAIFAIQNNNYPMIIAVLTITGFLTLLGYLISDILYALVDPRISYQ